jgi:heme exporter protein D
MPGGFSELSLNQKADLVWAACGIAVLALIGYATVRTLKTHKKIEKRMHLDDDDA